MARFGDLTANLREREAAKLLAWRPPAPMPERGSQPRDPTRPQPAGPFSPARFLAEQQAEQTAAQRAREAAARTRAREAQGR
jgi:hypothetical protein